MDISTEELPDGTCRVGYCPTEPGNYIIAVQFGEQHVPGTGPYWAGLGWTGLYWDVLGLDWAVLGHTGLYWVILGWTGLYWGSGSCAAPPSRATASLLCSSGSSTCLELGHTGLDWAVLGYTGLGWTGLYWVILGVWGLCCPINPGNCIIAVQFGEQHVPGTGLYWVILGHTGLYWVVLGYTGSILVLTGPIPPPPSREPLFGEGDGGGPCEGEHHPATPSPPRGSRGHRLRPQPQDAR